MKKLFFLILFIVNLGLAIMFVGKVSPYTTILNSFIAGILLEMFLYQLIYEK